jgi:hypothetical protein
MNDVVDRILEAYPLVRPLDAERAAESRRRTFRYLESLQSAGQRDATYLTEYGFAYLREMHEGRDPRYTGCQEAGPIQLQQPARTRAARRLNPHQRTRQARQMGYLARVAKQPAPIRVFGGQARGPPRLCRPHRQDHRGRPAMTGQDDILEKGRKRYEAGDKAAIPYSLNHCLINNLPVPPWLSTAFARACYKIDQYEVESWDDVLGKPLKKWQRPDTERRNKKIAGRLFLKVRERHKAGAAISKSLFEEVGEEFEFGVSGTVASEIYYKTKDHWEGQGFSINEIEEILEFMETLGRRD